MAQQPFSHSGTRKKLDVLARYLDAYTTALKKQRFELFYVDAFAGTGEIPLREGGGLLDDVEEIDPVIEGSAQRALQLRTPFDRYFFVEKSKELAAELKALGEKFPQLADRIEVERQDANSWLERFCFTTDWRSTRAVVFLDPFGNQVAWETLVAIAETKAINLWYLFPAGMGVNRQIARTGKVRDEHARSLDRMFGPNDWRSAAVEESSEPDLFGEAISFKKRTDPEGITQFMIDCMKKIFKGHVIDTWLPLGRNGAHWYSLLFASANPSRAAINLSRTLATAVMKQD